MNEAVHETIEVRRPQIGDIVPDTSDNHLAKKRQATKQELEDAFTAHQKGAPGSGDNLLKLTRKFVYNKLYRLELDGGFKRLGTSETVDDWTQDTLIDVWQKVRAGEIHGSYYAFLQSVIKYDKVDAHKYLMKQRKEKVSLEATVGEDAYTGEADGDADAENPAIYDERAYFNLPSDFTFPKSLLNGIDDEVVKSASDLIISGWSMKQIADHYGMTEAALSMRFKRLRDRMGIKPRTQKSAATVDAVDDEEDAA